MYVKMTVTKDELTHKIFFTDEIIYFTEETLTKKNQFLKVTKAKVDEIIAMT